MAREERPCPCRDPARQGREWHTLIGMPNNVCRTPRSRRGMSLLELLAVLVVLAILAGLAILSGRRSRARAELARLSAEARNFRLAEEIYRVDSNRMYNGPFTPDAVRAARFTYMPPPDVTIDIESANESTWAATMTSTSPAGSTSSDARPTCRLSLSGAAVACSLDRARQEDLPDAGAGGAPGSDVTPAR